MNSGNVSLTPDEEVILTNEFASVSVNRLGPSGRRRLRVTDGASGCVAELDPAGAFIAVVGKEAARSDKMEMEIEIDRAANGPRLKISAKAAGLCVYLDPLELSDAAVTGAWGKLPPAYDATAEGR